MKYLLDANVCIRYLNGRSISVQQKMRSVLAADICLCSVVKAEMIYGSMKSRSQHQSLAKQQKFFRLFISLPFDDIAATRCGELRANLAVKGTLIGPYDLQIASIALVHGLILVTHNTSEFSRVPGLNIEDWEI